MKKKPMVFSFFSGAGFLDLGFEDAGFEIAFVNEIHKPFLCGYVHSRKKLGLPELRPESPWFGYDLGDWSEEWDGNALQATKGLWMERDADYVSRRDENAIPNSPVPRKQ
jgi:site-specific DNA-cytosine methylase